LEDSIQSQAAELGIQLDDPDLKSWLGVPLLAGNQTIGVLATLDKTREHRFTEDDVALLSTVAGQVATALQNARLLEQVQQSARRERLIHEITTKVRRSPDIQTVLETTAREVGRALNVTRTTIRLGEAPPEHLPPDAQPPDEAAES
jgi:GAF domain-containing protein